MSESSVNFRGSFRGYDRTQVDSHMSQLAQSAATLWQESAERTRQLDELRAANGQLKTAVEEHSRRSQALEKALKEAAEPSYTGLGERIGTVLSLVDEEVRELLARARTDAESVRALADEASLATRQDGDEYARRTRNAADDEAAGILEDARAQAESLLEDARHQAEGLLEDARAHAERVLSDADRQTMARQDADRQAMARREEAEAVYEQARAKSAAAAVDFETTLAARREASASEFAAQITAAEHQLAAIRLRSEQTRSDSERAQQEAASKIAQQLEQATARAQTLVAEAKTKADRIRDNAEAELAAATQRRDSINAQITSARQGLAALGGVKRMNPMESAEAAGEQTLAEPNGAQQDGAQQNGAQHNGAQHNGAQHNGAQHNEAQQNGGQRKGAQQNGAQQNGSQENGDVAEAASELPASTPEVRSRD